MDRDQISDALRQYILNELLNAPNLDLKHDEPLVTSGLVGSFALVDIALFIENQYGVHISDRDLLAQKFDTVGQFADYVIRKQEKAA